MIPMAGDPLTEPGSSGKAAAGVGEARGEAQLANGLLCGLQHHKPFRYEDAQFKRSFYDFLGWGRAGGKEEAVSQSKLCSLSFNLKRNWRPVFKY